MKYKIGDKVKIRKDLRNINKEESVIWGTVKKMIKYEEKQATITRVCKTFYDLNIDNGEFNWTDEMLEEYKEVDVKIKTAIEKVWEDNLKLPKEDQWESKQEIMEIYCPNSSEIGLDLQEPKSCPEGYDDEMCIRCWNRKVEEKQEINNESESIFDKLHYSPVEFCFAPSTEEYLIEDLKGNEPILYMRQDERLTYEQIPEIIKWMQDVYNYTTELKNRIEYVDFMTAKEWMEKDINNKAKYGDFTYYIKDNELLCDDLYDACTLLLEAINSKEWILL